MAECKFEWEIKMKKIIPFFLLLLSTAFYSQSIKFEGIVKDTTNVPLEMANVMAVNKSQKRLMPIQLPMIKGVFY